MQVKTPDSWQQLQRKEGSSVQDANVLHQAAGGPDSSAGLDADELGHLKQITLLLWFLAVSLLQ